MPDGTIARAFAPRTDPPRGRMYATVGGTPLSVGIVVSPVQRCLSASL